MHAHTGDLVDTDQHRLSGLPGRGIVLHEVPRHLVETPARGDDVIVPLQVLLQALLHVDVLDVELIQLAGDALVQVADGDAQLVAAGVVVERHRGLVLHRALEVVGRHVLPENAPGDLVVGEQGRAGKADVPGVGQGVPHVERQRAVLGSVRLVGDDDDVVAHRVAGTRVQVELLDQREDVGLVLCQQAAEVLSVCRPAGFAVVIDHAAAGEGLVDLAVEVFAVGQHQEGEVAPQLAMHLAGEHHHRVALAGALGVPEDTEPALPLLAVAHRFDRPVDAEELVVASQDLPRLARGIVEKDEVLHQVQEVALVADPLQQRLHVDHARLFLVQALPLVEVFPTAGDRADLRLLAVGEHHHCVVVEEVGDGVAVVGVVPLESGLEVAVDVLALDEQQGQAVDEPDDVGAAAVEVPFHPQLAHAQEVIVGRLVEVEQAQEARLPLAPVVGEDDLYAIPNQLVLLTVGGNEGLGGGDSGDLPHRVLVRGVRQARVKLHELRAQRPLQYNLAVRGTAEQAAGAEALVVVGIDRLPAELLFEVVGGGLLDEGVLGVGGRGHSPTHPGTKDQLPLLYLYREGSGREDSGCEASAASTSFLRNSRLVRSITFSAGSRSSRFSRDVRSAWSQWYSHLFTAHLLCFSLHRGWPWPPPGRPDRKGLQLRNRTLQILSAVGPEHPNVWCLKSGPRESCDRPCGKVQVAEGNSVVMLWDILARR